MYNNFTNDYFRNISAIENSINQWFQKYNHNLCTLSNLMVNLNQYIHHGLSQYINWGNDLQKKLNNVQNILGIYAGKIDSASNLMSLKIQSFSEQILRLQNISISNIQPILESFSGLEIEEDLTNIEDITADEKGEFEQDLASIDIKQNWQQRLCEIVSKWNAKNPVIAGLILQIIIPLIIGNLLNYGCSAIKSAIIREEPKKDSKIIYQINETNQVFIVNEISYYYQVEILIDNEVKQGWVSKRSIKKNID